MKRRSLIFLVIAMFSTIAVVILELGIRSAVLSPSILLDAKKQDEVHKLLTGYSIYQGEYQLDIQNALEDNIDYPLTFQIGDTDYRFHKVDTEHVMLPAGEEMTVLTRRGMEPSFNKEVIVQSSERKFFFNEYIIRAVKKDASFSIPLQPEFRQSFTFWIYGCSFLLPILLALLFNFLLSVRNLFTLFTPFILVAILPLLLNYHFSMGYALLWTNSYIWSILLCLFLPTFYRLQGRLLYINGR